MILGQQYFIHVTFWDWIGSYTRKLEDIVILNKCTLIFMKIDLILGYKGILNGFLRTKILSMFFNT